MEIAVFDGTLPAAGGEGACCGCAAKWADNRKVLHLAFKPDWTNHADAAPFKRDDQMLAVMPIGVIVFRGQNILQTKPASSASGSIA